MYQLVLLIVGFLIAVAGIAALNVPAAGIAFGVGVGAFALLWNFGGGEV